MKTLLWIAAAIMAIFLIVDGVAVEIGWMKYVQTLGSVLFLAVFAFDKWIWRWKLLKGWFVKRPHIWGTWRVTIRSSYKKPGTDDVLPIIEGYMVVWQVYSRIRMKLFTKESASESLVAERIEKEDDSYELAVLYWNVPRLSVRDRSSIHLGGMILTVEEEPDSRMHGSYWTDRDTSGEIEMVDRRVSSFNSFEAAAKAFRVHG